MLEPQIKIVEVIVSEPTINLKWSDAIAQFVAGTDKIVDNILVFLLDKK